MNNKYIYEFYIDTKNMTVVKERFPIVYESNKEIVYVRDKGTTTKIEKNNSMFYDSFNVLLGNMDSQHHYLTTDCPKDFDGHALYFRNHEAGVVQTLKDLKQQIDLYNDRAKCCSDDKLINFYNDRIKFYTSEYNSILDRYKGYIEEDENGNIKLVQKEKED